MRYEIQTEGMGCQHCVNRVSVAVAELGAGVVSVKLNKICVDYSGEQTVLVNAINELGFAVLSICEID